eukprot:COSAG02_NODE_44_length_45948_cov_81.673493_26_plen_95_part_00
MSSKATQSRTKKSKGDLQRKLLERDRARDTPAPGLTEHEKCVQNDSPSGPAARHCTADDRWLSLFIGTIQLFPMARKGTSVARYRHALHEAIIW